MLIALTVALGILLLNFIWLYTRAVRENIALGEYSQFLLLNPDSYGEQRRKFVEYLGTTGNKTPHQRGSDALKAIAKLARNVLGNIMLANVASRNAAAGK